MGDAPPAVDKSIKLTHTYARRLTVWHDIVLKQLETYKPDVIVFGNVFDLFLNDEQENPYQLAEKDDAFSKQIEEKTGVACHYWRLGEGQRIIHPYHPGIPCLQGVQGLEQRYCEGVYSALMKAAEELGTSKDS